MSGILKKYYLLFALLLCLFASCRQRYEVQCIRGELQAMDSCWDAAPHEEAMKLLAPYKQQLDSLMDQVVGTVAYEMTVQRPESPLSNLVADVLRMEVEALTASEIDVALMNVGGIRSNLRSGTLTVRNLYELLPFENKVALVTLKGKVLKQLGKEIALRRGNGVSGMELLIDERTGALKRMTVKGGEVADEKLYKLATIDFLADGNDGMTALLQAEAVQVMPVLLRDLFRNYVERLAAEGKAVESETDGRIRLMGMAEAETRELVLLHTSDVHSRLDPLSQDGLGGVVRRATYLKQMRAKHPELLLTDGGDWMQGTPYFNFFRGETEVKMMNLLGYEVSTLGNHEFDLGMEQLAQWIKAARWTVVCANYELSDTPLQGLVKRYTVMERQGVRIGFFGLSPELTLLVDAANYRGLRYLDPIAAARKVVEELREKEQCDVVVCLSHLGVNEEGISDEEVIAGTAGIDLVLGGHSHELMLQPQTLKNREGKEVSLFHAGRDGAYVGKIVITLKPI